MVARQAIASQVTCRQGRSNRLQSVVENFSYSLLDRARGVGTMATTLLIVASLFQRSELVSSRATGCSQPA